MKQDLFQFLPSEITFNILSRLSVRAIAMSKCVCKPWLDLLETNDFVNSHLSKSVPALAVLMKGEESKSMRCKVFEFDEADDDDVDRRYNPLTEFDFPLRIALVGAADGLLLLKANLRTLYICNPITREYVKLSCAIKASIAKNLQPTCGFGASRVTGQHKVVHIIPKPDSRCICHVYTLETGLWRCFDATATPFRYCDMNFGAFVNGNLHWIGAYSILSFDLETECFSTFSGPSRDETGYNTSVCGLMDYLCVCAATPTKDCDAVIGIWLMKEYGVEKSWTKEYVIGKRTNFARDFYHQFYPMKVFKDGDILISRGGQGLELFHYSHKTQDARKIGMFRQADGYLESLILTPSFLSLKSLGMGMENVISF